jgi:hypothetical protein
MDEAVTSASDFQPEGVSPQGMWERAEVEIPFCDRKSPEFGRESGGSGVPAQLPSPAARVALAPRGWRAICRSSRSAQGRKTTFHGR